MSQIAFKLSSFNRKLNNTKDKQHGKYCAVSDIKLGRFNKYLIIDRIKTEISREAGPIKYYSLGFNSLTHFQLQWDQYYNVF